MLLQKNPDLSKKNEEIVRESTYGNPENVMLWASHSLRGIAEELKKRYEITVSINIVSKILEKLGYSK